MNRRTWGWIIFLPLLATVVTVGAALIYLPSYAVAIFIGARLAKATELKRGGWFGAWLIGYSAIFFLVGVVATTFLLRMHFTSAWGIH